MRRSWFAGPYILWMVLFTVVPVLLVAAYAVTSTDGAFTLSNLREFFQPTYLGILGHSVRLALSCTALCLLIGYPAALFMADRKLGIKGTIIALFVVPMWMNFLLRTYSWMTLLETNGIVARFINHFVTLAGHEPVRLLYSDSAVLMGMVYNFLPFMVLPLHSVLDRMDVRVHEAAEDLGASGVQVFLRVTLPLSMPGVLSGITMVFMPAVTTFVISRLLGGGNFMLFGDLIEQQILTIGNINFGSALSLIMMALMLVSMGILNRFGDQQEGGGAIW